MTAPGPLGEEARLLLEAARDWAARTFPDVQAHLATGSAECQWCPLCRAVAALRTPEATDRLAAALTAAAGALVTVFDTLTAPPQPPADQPPAAGPPAQPPAAGPPAAAAQPIPLDQD